MAELYFKFNQAHIPFPITGDDETDYLKHLNQKTLKIHKHIKTLKKSQVEMPKYIQLIKNNENRTCTK